MKQSLFVSDLSLYDIANVVGVAADLSHIETRPVVSGHNGPSELANALSGANVVLIPAGVPRKPGKLIFKKSGYCTINQDCANTLETKPVSWVFA